MEKRRKRRIAEKGGWGEWKKEKKGGARRIVEERNQGIGWWIGKSWAGIGGGWLIKKVIKDRKRKRRKREKIGGRKIKGWGGLVIEDSKRKIGKFEKRIRKRNRKPIIIDFGIRKTKRRRDFVWGLYCRWGNLKKSRFWVKQRD